jgi:hypothetical protein
VGGQLIGSSDIVQQNHIRFFRFDSPVNNDKWNS